MPVGTDVSDVGEGCVTVAGASSESEDLVVVGSDSLIPEVAAISSNNFVKPGEETALLLMVQDNFSRKYISFR
jgi:hypothetical protein